MSRAAPRLRVSIARPPGRTAWSEHWSRSGESNPGQPPYHGGALPTELLRLYAAAMIATPHPKLRGTMAGCGGSYRSAWSS